jgi:Family of unknown function (DUF6526)
VAETKQQSFTNHSRFDPLYHFFIAPVALVNLVLNIRRLIVSPSMHTAWLVVLGCAVFAAVYRLRTYPLKVQDRVIRLEERLRLEALLSDPAARAKVLELTVGQLVALRFASNEELPALADQALSNHLVPKEIKQNIRNWRADHFRV